MGKIFDSKSTYFEEPPNTDCVVHSVGTDIFPVEESLTSFVIKRIFHLRGPSTLLVRDYDMSVYEHMVQSIIQTSENKAFLARISQNHCYPKLYMFGIKYFINGARFYANGASFESEFDALQRAYGEYLERLSQDSLEKILPIIPNKKSGVIFFKLLKSSFRMEYIPSPLEQQPVFKFFPKNSELTHIPSVVVTNATLGRSEYLPIALFYFGNTVKKGDYFFHQRTTNGAGAGLTLHDARLSAICELIERDHFLLYWLSGIAPPQVDIATLPNSTREKIQSDIAQYKIEVYILNTTYDAGLFSCIVVIVDPILHKIAFGGSAHPNPHQAIIKAYSESLVGLHYSNDEPGEMSDTFINNYRPFTDEKIDIKKRVHLYNNPFGIQTVRDLFLSGKSVSFASIATNLPITFSGNSSDDLEKILAHFSELSKHHGPGYNVYFHEYNSALLKKNRYIVTKSFVPSLLKLWLDEHLATPRSKRLFEFSEKKLKQGTDTPNNILPHPFP